MNKKVSISEIRDLILRLFKEKEIRASGRIEFGEIAAYVSIHGNPPKGRSYNREEILSAIDQLEKEGRIQRAGESEDVENDKYLLTPSGEKEIYGLASEG